MDKMLEEKVAKYVELRKQIEELEAQRKTIAVEILECMPKEQQHVDLEQTWIKRATLFSVKTSLKDAQLFDAVRVKEVVDKEKLKELYKLGHNPPGVSEIHYLQVYTKKTTPEEVLTS